MSGTRYAPAVSHRFDIFGEVGAHQRGDEAGIIATADQLTFFPPGVAHLPKRTVIVSLFGSVPLRPSLGRGGELRPDLS